MARRFAPRYHRLDNTRNVEKLSGLAGLPAIETLLADGIAVPSPEAEARICGVVMDFAFWAAPRHALLGRCAARVLELLNRSKSIRSS